MNGTLKVDPQKLITASGEFEKASSDIQRITSEMKSIVDQTVQAWTGDAQATYKASFANLDDDMTKLFTWVKEHATDLNEMARNYIQADTDAGNLGASLPADVL
ncbi:MAG: WXG100 family type VII secretion target [Lachnospiraceae bacterium]|nr:WXG100 family type VII secretion target [Lachnospiraceae bacterium]